MGRTCTVCGHEQRNEIDQALISGTGLRKIAERFSGTSVTALHRHKAHVAANIAMVHEAKEFARADSLLDRLMALSRETAEILREARGGKDHELALRAIARAEKQIELQARLLGELKDAAPTVNVAVANLTTPKETNDELTRIGTILDILAQAGAVPLPGAAEAPLIPDDAAPDEVHPTPAD